MIAVGATYRLELLPRTLQLFDRKQIASVFLLNFCHVDLHHRVTFALLQVRHPLPGRDNA